MESSFPDVRYEIIRKLSKGTFRQVYKARHRIKEEIVALKVINWDPKGPMLPEVSLLRRLKHRNIVTLIDHAENDIMSKLLLVLEYIPRTLKQHIRSVRELDPTDIKSLMQQLLSGVKFCHEQNVLHRGLTPVNILVDRQTQRLKIAGFGSAISCANPHEPLDPHEGSLWYRAPDVLLGNAAYGPSIDIWATGCVMAEMLLSKAPFREYSVEKQLGKIFRVMGTPTEETWPGLSRLPGYEQYKPKWEMHPPRDLSKCLPMLDAAGIDLLQQMLQLRPEQRISATDALKHPWFAEARQGNEEEE